MLLTSRYIYYFFLLFTPFITYSQEPLPVTWGVFESSQTGTRQTESWDVASDASGNIYWLVDAMQAGEGFDVHVYKLREDGSMVWDEPIMHGGPNMQRSYRLLLHDSLLLIGGRACSHEGLETCDYRIWAHDHKTKEEQFTYEADLAGLYEECDGIIPLQNGYFITGWTETDTSRLDVFLARLNENGQPLWERRWGSPLGEHQDGHIAMIDSSIYICGAYGQEIPGYVNSLFNGRSFLAAFDVHTGTLIDSVTWRTAKKEFIYVENALGLSAHNRNIYVVGTYSEGFGEWQTYVAKYSEDFDRIWFRSWGFAGVESARSLVVHPEYGIFVAGQSQWGEGNDHDLALLQFSPEGHLMNTWRWGDTLDDTPYSIYHHGNTLYLCGESEQAGNTSDAFILSVPLDALTTGVYPPLRADTKCRLSPNPVHRRSPVQRMGPVKNEVKWAEWIDESGRRFPIDKTDYDRFLSPRKRGMYWLIYDRKGVKGTCGPLIVE